MIIQNGHIISETEQYKFLDVQIDSKIPKKAHVQYLVQKLNAALFTIRIVSVISDSSTTTVVYFVYFHSLMTSGIICGVTALIENGHYCAGTGGSSNMWRELANPCLPHLLTWEF